MERHTRSILATAAAIVIATPAFGAFSYSGGTYTQDFNGLPSTQAATITLIGKGPFTLQGSTDVGATMAGSGVTGWYIANTPLGSSANTEYRAQDGSLSGSAGRGAISYGTIGSTERALGALSTSNQVNSFGLVISNDSAVAITDFTLGFTGEQWRRGDIITAPFDKLIFEYAVSPTATDNITSALTWNAVTALNFTSPNTVAPINTALNGNLAVNQTVLSSTISGISWTPGQILILRWTAQDLTGQDDGLSIDNLSFSAPVPEPTSLALLGLGALPLLRRRRR